MQISSNQLTSGDLNIGNISLNTMPGLGKSACAVTMALRCSSADAVLPAMEAEAAVVTAEPEAGEESDAPVAVDASACAGAAMLFECV